MRRFQYLSLLAATSLCITSASDLLGQLIAVSDEVRADPKKNNFIRMVRDAENQPASLQTAITTFRPKSGFGTLQVDLVGAVHVGDKAYYEALNKRFADYDVVLYELVAPKGTTIPQGGRKEASSNPISMLQSMTKDMLNLSSQMNVVDYTKANFVHADMSPAEIQDTMSKRGDTPTTVVLSALTEMMRSSNLRAQQAESAEPLNEFAENPLSMLFDPQRDTKMKVMMAEQFSNMGTDMMGATINQLLIEDRNAAAMQEFQKQIVSGKQRIAIFYGAAHLPDFEQRLERDFDMARTNTDWVTAWDLKKPSKNQGQKQDPLNSLLRTLLQQ